MGIFKGLAKQNNDQISIYPPKYLDFGDCLYTRVKIKVKHPESEAIKNPSLFMHQCTFTRHRSRAYIISHTVSA